MRPIRWLVGVSILVAGFAATASADEAKTPEGKAIFLKYKCTSCHTIAAQDIGKAKAAAAAAQGQAQAGAKRKAPDLSAVGVERKADWIKSFLTKKEKIETRMHPIRFRGTDAELTKLAAWLESLKEKAALKKAEAKPSEATEKAKEAAESAEESAKKSEEAAVKSKEASEKAGEAADKAKEAADEASEADKK